jgi:hypothetical protein
MENQTSHRGGKRPGAGRKKGAKDKATIEQKATLEELARSHTETAINVLVQVAKSSESDAARVSAASVILDRGYGKSRQAIELTGKDGGSIKTEEVSARETILDRIAGLAARTGAGGDPGKLN